MFQKDTFDIHFTQLLLSQKEIISQINNKDKEKILNLTYKFVEQQINSKDYYLFDISVSVFLISKLTNFINIPSNQYPHHLAY